MQRLIPTAAMLGLLAGCAPEAGTLIVADPAFPAFGTATANNLAVQTGEAEYLVGFNARFSESVPTMINFAFDSAALSAEARATLDQQASFIRQFPEVGFRVFGHTDLVGSDAYNYDLGLRRANAAVNYLITHGISRSRLEAVVSYGETQPLITTTDPERANRRTVTEVSGFVSGHPNVLNGKYAEVIFRDYVASAAPSPTVQSAGQSLGGGGGGGAGGGGGTGGGGGGQSAGGGGGEG
ncbi:OmpA family protein [Pseudoroseicyclus tamaricis]|uniref:OmpA family protein n=1 Tax=Pseudoroseicyclus tamaricis TaxID=2705421 RepID=A0A6B2JUQ4_9RHOB|nr:OmpA family protein [Pseudoroseicyclus tamaricis]